MVIKVFSLHQCHSVFFQAVVSATERNGGSAKIPRTVLLYSHPFGIHLVNELFLYVCRVDGRTTLVSRTTAGPLDPQLHSSSAERGHACKSSKST